MPLNCNTCNKKHNVIPEGHCSEFSHIPEIDACAMHSDGMVVKAVAAKPTGTFLWLDQTHTSTKEVPPTHPVPN